MEIFSRVRESYNEGMRKISRREVHKKTKGNEIQSRNGRTVCERMRNNCFHFFLF